MRTLNEISLAEKDRRAIEAASAILRRQFPVERVVVFGSKVRGNDDHESGEAQGTFYCSLGLGRLRASMASLPRTARIGGRHLLPRLLVPDGGKTNVRRVALLLSNSG